MIRWSAKEIAVRLRELPMLRVLIPVAGGVIVSRFLALPELFLWAGVVVAGGCALWFRSSLYTVVALLLLGMGAASLHEEEVALPLGERLLVALRIEEEPRVRERYASASARVEAWCDATGQWHGSEKRLTLYADSTWVPRVGESLVAVGRITPYSSKYPFYRSLQASRGYAGRIWVGESGLVERDTTQRFGWFAGLHQGAVERIERLGLSTENRALVEAMSLGERARLTPSLRDGYARSGTAHLLAVSGLHVGILFVAINLLLGGLPLLRGGHRLKNLLALLLVWGYALLCGASPSVLRAAWMCSALQVALALSLRYRGLNILFGVAVVMLLLEPMQLFDISFQLSFLAVAAILSWGIPLLGGLRSHLTRGFAALFLIGVVATLATAPLVAYRFGILSPIGLFINPVVIFLAQLIISLSLVWILLPFAFWQPLFAWAIEGLASLQNQIVEGVAALPYASFELHPSGLAVGLIYLLFALLTLLSWGFKVEKNEIFKKQNKSNTLSLETIDADEL